MGDHRGDAFAVHGHAFRAGGLLQRLASGCWGLLEFRLGARGYLYYQPDWGVEDPDECLPIFGGLPGAAVALRAPDDPGRSLEVVEKPFWRTPEGQDTGAAH